MRSEDKKTKKSEPKSATLKKIDTRLAGPSAKQRRHERRLLAARQARSYGKRGGRAAQERIDQKAATRRRMKSYTPAVRAERSAAGREHRKPRK